MARFLLAVRYGLVPNGPGAADVMWKYPVTGAARFAQEPYGYPVTGNINAGAMFGYRAAGAKIMMNNG